MNALVFIDTNIFLDFYRARGGDAGLSLLNHIASNHERVITTGQVEMEYKKNRQRVILESLQGVKPLDWHLSAPSFLAQSRQSKSIDRSLKQIRTQVDQVRRRIEGVLRNPSKYDRVFAAAQALFRNTAPINLSRSNPARDTVRRLAFKRFILGYPPRKDGDTSIGDAINWEWMIRCVGEHRKDLVIVTRDSDYGRKFSKDTILNDWLAQEFRERTTRRRKVILTERLTEAFKLISVPVTQKEVAQETALISESKAASTPPTIADLLQKLPTPQATILRLLRELPDKSPEIAIPAIMSATGFTAAEVRAHAGEGLRNLESLLAEMRGPSAS